MNLTSIPAHIVNYVNHEKLSEKIDSKFHQYEKLVKDELDKRQMGGGSLIFELLESRISKLILDQLSALKTTIDNRAEGLGVRAAGDVVQLPEFKWDSSTS